ncbi:MAG: GNAT family N-acetyltransferase [Verrucomicrobia bacterium]|nr:GNAT family N-acetyltransferase [Verrucomicrobiota bacterium]MBS0637694.1 GNAT family N-acetyltransferase [Verrucomicrobiota bacterium]
MSFTARLEILDSSHLQHLTQHFFRLSVHDRQLRFKNACTDETLLSYINSIDFVRDKILGIWSGERTLVAVGHLTFYNRVADISLSVNLEHRRFGYGQFLLEQAKLLTQQHRCTELKVSCLRANSSMIFLASKNGFSINCQNDEDVEWEGSCSLEPVAAE